MPSEPGLTCKERKDLSIYYRDSPYWRPREEVVADAATRKALWYLVELAEKHQATTHEHAAMMLREMVIEMGIEPWEES